MYTPSEINSKNRLAGILRCETSQIDNLVDKIVPTSSEEFPTGEFTPMNYIVLMQDDFIKEIKLLKRKASLGYRTVYSVIPHFALNALKALKFYLNDLYNPNDCVHGFVKKRNIVSNAKKHLNKKIILNIDIKDFFESINLKMVKVVFNSLGFDEDISNILSKITTYNDRLVAGFSTSPVIANLYCMDMDEEIVRICSEYNITYTRYADDITLSGDTVDILYKLQEILCKYGFKINDFKTKKYYKGSGQYVTGLSVEDSIMPRIPKYIKKRLRAEVYCICKYGLKSNVARVLKIDENKVSEKLLKKRSAKIIGWLSFINSVEYQFASNCFRSLLNISDPYDLYFINNAIKHIDVKIHT